MQQIIPLLLNLKTQFERPSFGLTSHSTPMCSVVFTPHQLKIVSIRNKKSNFHEILNINSTDVALYEMHMLIHFFKLFHDTER